MLGSLLLGVVFVVVTQLARLQRAEAEIAALVLAFVMFPDAHVPVGSDIVVFSLTDSTTMGVQFSAQNAAALLSLPLLLATVAIIWLRPHFVRPAVHSLIAAVGVLVLENQVRVLLTSLIADSAPPHLRYNVGATIFSSMTTVICMAIAVLLFIFVFVTTRRRHQIEAGTGATG
ncbi:hypothetical protein [Amycolatopsis anabasis]|uniref:hypothetical protein n=1 Tax=Amycolatopsis anabasis TaxID=1840409 RepID=UPI00131AB779|nr:hypothetical protein [Amycolatopsis anabasis]